jgi:large subunit ribosomal protein L6
MDNEILIKTGFDKRKIKALVGTIYSHIKNMILGVTIGFRYEMKIIYTHFPVSVSVKDDKIDIRNFLGEKETRTTKIVGKTDVKIEKDIVVLTGNNIEDVSQTAANIERACKLSKRDRRIFTDGIYISGKYLQTGEPV